MEVQAKVKKNYQTCSSWTIYTQKSKWPSKSLNLKVAYNSFMSGNRTILFVINWFWNLECSVSFRFSDLFRERASRAGNMENFTDYLTLIFSSKFRKYMTSWHPALCYGRGPRLESFSAFSRSTSDCCTRLSITGVSEKTLWKAAASATLTDFKLQDQ